HLIIKIIMKNKISMLNIVCIILINMNIENKKLMIKIKSILIERIIKLYQGFLQGMVLSHLNQVIKNKVMIVLYQIVLKLKVELEVLKDQTKSVIERYRKIKQVYSIMQKCLKAILI